MARHWRPLVDGWLWSLGLVFLLWAFVRFLVPAADDMLRPLYYWVAPVPGLIGTWRWLRPRGAQDRRADDRRQSPRRARRGDPPADR